MRDPKSEEKDATQSPRWGRSKTMEAHPGSPSRASAEPEDVQPQEEKEKEPSQADGEGQDRPAQASRVEPSWDPAGEDDAFAQLERLVREGDIEEVGPVGERDLPGAVDYLASRLGAVEDMTVRVAERLSGLRDSVGDQGERTRESLHLLASRVGAQVEASADRLERLEEGFEQVRRAIETLESNVRRILTALNEQPEQGDPSSKPKQARVTDSLIEQVWSEEG